MTQDPPAGAPAPAPHDDLAAQVAAALRSRAPDDATVAATARRVAARVEAAAGRGGVVTPFARRAGGIAVTGVVASALGVVGAGAAAAANPYTDFAAAVDGVAQAVGVGWSSMPEGYTREQYEAFWGAEYTSGDLAALQDLWDVGTLEAKARAGQMILDGETVPVAPGATGPQAEPHVVGPEDMETFRRAGYTTQDAERLAELWQIDMYEAKSRVADMLRDGETPPRP